MRKILATTILVVMIGLSFANAQVDENGRTTNTELQRNIDSVENNTRVEDINLDTANTDGSMINSAGETVDPDASRNNSAAESRVKDTKSNRNRNQNLKRKDR